MPLQRAYPLLPARLIRVVAMVAKAAQPAYAVLLLGKLFFVLGLQMLLNS